MPGCVARNTSPRPKHPLAEFDLLNLWYFGDHPRRQQPELAPDARLGGFDEVVGGLSHDEAVFEAKRCLSCGNCIECDGCLGACPEDAVIKLGPGQRYRFDYDRCTGCQACFEQCPVHSIEMVPDGAPDPQYAFVAPPDPTWRYADARDHRRQRSGGVGRVPMQRGLLHLPDHAVLADGRVG